VVTSGMEHQLILVADNDAKNLEILRENLEASGFLVSSASNGKEAWEEISSTKPKLALTETSLPGLSGFQLMERMKNDPETASIPVIFLTKQRDVQQRLRAFELGAKDYLVKPLHVKEVIAHIRMILRRLKKFDVEAADVQNQFSGKLEQLNLADLIESFGVERKTGILTLSNSRRSGQVFFREGAVVNARLGDFKMEHALYQMFPWKKGFFKMIFRDVDIAEEISISNLGLLLQGLKRIDLREKLLKKLPSPKATFYTTPVFEQLLEKKKLNNGVSEFTRLLDGKHTIEQIIDESGLDDLVALKRLVRLYQQGFIKTDVKVAKKKNQPELEKVFAGLEEDSLSQRLSSRPPIQPTETEISVEPPNGKDEEAVEKGPIFPGLENKETYKPSREEVFQQDSPPSLELRQERKESVQFSDSSKKKPSLEPPPTIDTNKTLFEEVFLEDESEKSAPSQQETETTSPPDQDNFPDREREAARQNSILADENIEDYVFEVNPQRRGDDLENEIKPLISEIEKASERKDKTESQTTESSAEPPEETDIPDKILEFSPPEEKISTPDEQQETFVDEELLRQAAHLQWQKQATIAETPPKPPDQPAKAEKKQPRPATGDKIVLISVDEDCKDSVMDILTHDNFKSLKVLPEQNFNIDVGKINLNAEREVKLISVPIEKQLNPFLESIEDSALACLFTFDCSRPETWEYTGYLIHSISDKFGAPFAVLVMNLDEQESLTTDVIRYKLNLSAENPVLPCDETDENCVRQLLDTIKNFAGIV